VTSRAAPAALLACAAIACGGPAGPVDFAIDAPPAGTAVRPGQEVLFRLAVDGSRNTAYQLSLAGRGPVGRAEGSGAAIIPWTVPADAAAGQRLVFTAIARDTATNATAAAETHLVVAGRPAAAEHWTGTWTGRATGARMYDDEVSARFAFTVSAEGTIAGRGTATLQARTVKTKGCTYVHTQTPAEFPVIIGGRREGGHFALRIEGPGMVAQRTTTPSCAPPGPATPYDALGMVGIHAAGLAPRVPAVDGGEARVAGEVATLKVVYRTTVRRP
jgi:hypothetical protein